MRRSWRQRAASEAWAAAQAGAITLSRGGGGGGCAGRCRGLGSWLCAMHGCRCMAHPAAACPPWGEQNHLGAVR